MRNVDRAFYLSQKAEQAAGRAATAAALAVAGVESAVQRRRGLVIANQTHRGMLIEAEARAAAVNAHTFAATAFRSIGDMERAGRHEAEARKHAQLAGRACGIAVSLATPDIE